MSIISGLIAGVTVNSQAFLALLGLGAASVWVQAAVLIGVGALTIGVVALAAWGVYTGYKALSGPSKAVAKNAKSQKKSTKRADSEAGGAPKVKTEEPKKKKKAAQGTKKTEQVMKDENASAPPQEQSEAAKSKEETGDLIQDVNLAKIVPAVKRHQKRYLDFKHNCTIYLADSSKSESDPEYIKLKYKMLAAQYACLYEYIDQITANSSQYKSHQAANDSWAAVHSLKNEVKKQMDAVAAELGLQVPLSSSLVGLEPVKITDSEQMEKYSLDWMFGTYYKVRAPSMSLGLDKENEYEAVVKPPAPRLVIPAPQPVKPAPAVTAAPVPTSQVAPSMQAVLLKLPKPSVSDAEMEGYIPKKKVQGQTQDLWAKVPPAREATAKAVQKHGANSSMAIGYKIVECEAEARYEGAYFKAVPQDGKDRLRWALQNKKQAEAELEALQELEMAPAEPAAFVPEPGPSSLQSVYAAPVPTSQVAASTAPKSVLLATWQDYIPAEPVEDAQLSHLRSVADRLMKESYQFMDDDALDALSANLAYKIARMQHYGAHIRSLTSENKKADLSQKYLQKEFQEAQQLENKLQALQAKQPNTSRPRTT